jgi:hypothetical protein
VIDKVRHGTCWHEHCLVTNARVLGRFLLYFRPPQLAASLFAFPLQRGTAPQLPALASQVWGRGGLALRCPDPTGPQ